MKSNSEEEYDRSIMQEKEGILRFEWGDYPAIGMMHFEERRDERTRPSGTDIFDETNLSDEQVLLRCFEMMENDKYQEILDTFRQNKPQHTEFIVGFETDEPSEDGRGFLYVFIVFSISVKETAMNGIAIGEEFLSCITVVKEAHKRKHRLPANTVEKTLCCYREQSGGDYKWKKEIPQKRY